MFLNRIHSPRFLFNMICKLTRSHTPASSTELNLLYWPFSLQRLTRLKTKLTELQMFQILQRIASCPNCTFWQFKSVSREAFVKQVKMSTSQLDPLLIVKPGKARPNLPDQLCVCENWWLYFLREPKRKNHPCCFDSNRSFQPHVKLSLKRPSHLQ